MTAVVDSTPGWLIENVCQNNALFHFPENSNMQDCSFQLTLSIVIPRCSTLYMKFLCFLSTKLCRTKIRSPWRFSNYIKVTDIEHSNYMKSIPSTIWMSSNRIDRLSIHFIPSWWDFLLLLSSAYWCSLLRLPLDVLPKTNKPERAIRNFHRRSPAVDSMIDLICSESRPNYTPEDFPRVRSSFSFFALFISSSIWNLHPRTWSFIRLQ